MNPSTGRLSFAVRIGLTLLLWPSHTSAQNLYSDQLAPMVQQYCGNCHGGARGRGGVSFASLAQNGGFVANPTIWRRALKALEERSMPENAERLKFTEIERQKMVMLIDRCLRRPDVTDPKKDPGPARLRLLSSYEYACTIRDLLGVTDLPLEKLPGDYGNPAADGQDDTMGLSPLLMNRYLNVAEDILDSAPRERIVTVEPSDKLSKRDAATQILKAFQTRAFRRPVSDEDQDRLMKLYDEVDKLNLPFDQTLRIALTGVLASSKFITHFEQSKRGDGPQPIDEYDLANRLSYFIWSSMPDDELIQLAGKGELANPTQLEKQVRRMLADPKAKALAENFGGQWLGWKNLRNRASTTQPTTQPDLDAIRRDAIEYLDPILRSDKSLLALIEDERRNVLELRAFHIVSSVGVGTRTSPPRRGRWVLEALLGEHVSPGLYDTCRVTKEIPGVEGEALYAKLRPARAQATCAICHDRIDPPGMILERFDAQGQVRKEQPDIGALRQQLVAQKGAFTRNLVERMLGYALGRNIEACDATTVEEICETLTRQDYRASTLVLEIARSVPFNFRRPVEN